MIAQRTFMVNDLLEQTKIPGHIKLNFIQNLLIKNFSAVDNPMSETSLKLTVVIRYLSMFNWKTINIAPLLKDIEDPDHRLNLIVTSFYERIE